MVPSAQNLLGLENVRADFNSLPIPNQQNRLHLNPTIFQATYWLWGPQEVELFATRLAAQFS